MMEGKKPIFIKIEEYDSIIDIMNLIKEKIAESKELINKINQLRTEEDLEITNWKAQLDSIEKKVGNIDKMLFKQE